MLASSPVHSISTTAIDIHFHQYGNPAGKPVFLLHGFPDSPAAWLPVIDRLDKGKLRLIVPYLRGAGPTSIHLPNHLSGEPAALASDLLTLADHLSLDCFHIVGQDWGALAAYSTAVLAPERVRGLLTIASPYVSPAKPLPNPQVQAFWYQWFFNTARGSKAFTVDPIPFCRHLWKAWSPKWDFAEKDFAEAARSFTNPQFTSVVLHFYRQRYGADPRLPPYHLASEILDTHPRISVPTIYIQGADDACTLPASSLDQKPSFTGPYGRVLLKNTGHFPHREDPKSTAKFLNRLLSKHP